MTVSYTHLESILPGGDEVEIIIVNDGSKDKTSQIAHEYMDKYPDIIKVIDKENGGHGNAVNAGLANASGKYFKAVYYTHLVHASLSYFGCFVFLISL